MLSTLIIGTMTLKPIAAKADSKVELTAGVTSYLNDVMLGKIEPTVVQNEHGLVVDENEYVVIASDDLPHGTVVDTPIGIQGIVYDEGSGNGNLDIYCDW